MAIDLLYSYDFVIIRDHSLLIAGGAGGLGDFGRPHGFLGRMEGGSVVTYRVWRGDYRKLTANVGRFIRIL